MWWMGMFIGLIIIGIGTGAMVYPEYKNTAKGTWWVLLIAAGVAGIMYKLLR